MTEEVRTYRGQERIRALLFGRKDHVVQHDTFRGKRIIIYEPFEGTAQDWLKIRQYFRISIYPEPFDKPENFKVFMDCPFCTPEETQPFTRLMSARTHMQRKHPHLIKRYIKRARYEERA